MKFMHNSQFWKNFALYWIIFFVYFFIYIRGRKFFWNLQMNWLFDAKNKKKSFPFLTSRIKNTKAKYWDKNCFHKPLATNKILKCRFFSVAVFWNSIEEKFIFHRKLYKIFKCILLIILLLHYTLYLCRIN